MIINLSGARFILRYRLGSKVSVAFSREKEIIDFLTLKKLPSLHILSGRTSSGIFLYIFLVCAR